MRYRVLLSFILCSYLGVRSAMDLDDGASGDSDFGGGLISQLRNDANLDLSVDEEYEDLRAELLAYHTALASLSSRRSLLSTPCWALGGICVNHQLCAGARFMTEVPGCKNRHNVCCFAWNRYQIKDMREKGIKNFAVPWSIHEQVGGKGIMTKDDPNSELEKKSQYHQKLRQVVADTELEEHYPNLNREVLIFADKSDERY